MQAGKFITIEGIDGVGKSTAINDVADYLRAKNYKVLLTREPGGTVLGEEIRAILIGHADEAISEDAELLLFFAARAQHLHKKIIPALEHGTWVVCDRFTDASYAYQSGGRGISEERLAVLERWVQRDLQPDLTFLLDAPLAICRQRSGKRGLSDRFEEAQDTFFEKVRQVYLTRAAHYAERFRVIDASGTRASVSSQIQQLLADYGI